MFHQPCTAALDWTGRGVTAAEYVAWVVSLDCYLEGFVCACVLYTGVQSEFASAALFLSRGEGVGGRME